MAYFEDVDLCRVLDEYFNVFTQYNLPGYVKERVCVQGKIVTI